MIAYLDETESPAGRIAFAVNESGELIRVSFQEGDYHFSLEEELDRDGYSIHYEPERTDAVRAQLDEYTTGERLEFDLPLAFSGTEWQRRVWNELRNIPFGEVRSYGEVADVVCTRRAARAVGRANASNPIPLVVPCHRVIGANGALTGFGGGLHLKTRLLEHELSVIRRTIGAPEGTQRELFQPVG